MAQETAKAVIDRLQGEAGYATGGYIDRLVFSGLDVHEMLNEIEQAIDTDEKTVEKLQEQLNTAKKALTEIAEIINDDIHECDYSCDNDCELDGSLNMYSVENVQSVIDSALAEIGDEGSGDE